MFQIENRFVLTLFILLAIVSSWGFYLMQQQHANKIKNYGHYPDSMAIELKSSNYDAMGFLTQTVQAKKAVKTDKPVKTVKAEKAVQTVQAGETVQAEKTDQTV